MYTSPDCQADLSSFHALTLDRCYLTGAYPSVCSAITVPGVTCEFYKDSYECSDSHVNVNSTGNPQIPCEVYTSMICWEDES